MNQVATHLEGPILIEPAVHGDARGFFVETYRKSEYEKLGIVEDFVQDNHSRSTRGVVRGIHFQLPPGQAKLVRCSRGAIFDVVVDLRRGSPTFGRRSQAVASTCPCSSLSLAILACGYSRTIP